MLQSSLTILCNCTIQGTAFKTLQVYLTVKACTFKYYVHYFVHIGNDDEN